MAMTRICVGICFCLFVYVGTGFGADPAEVGKYVEARVEIGEMMTEYFSGGQAYGGGARPSPEKMKEIGADINEKLSTLLAKYDLTVEEYRQRSPEIFADDAAVMNFLSENPELNERYKALPFDRMGRGGSGRGY
ncbi:MAG: hypothetical protein NPIRA02_09960 [Nitrospirales bacterium]|nr:MAG: hypothetical protein NPIRA02_09960 [Nitrospirales bacterium]